MFNLTETCTCGAKGDMMNHPIHAGVCGTCENVEVCKACGHLDHDHDGTTRWCGPCYDEIG